MVSGQWNTLKDAEPCSLTIDGHNRESEMGGATLYETAFAATVSDTFTFGFKEGAI
jgi:hypothetical protein